VRQRTARDLSSVDRGQKSGPHLIVPQLDDSLVKRPPVYERRSPEGVPTGDRAVSDRLEEKSVSRLTVCRSRSAPGSNSKAGQHESRGLRQPWGPESRCEAFICRTQSQARNEGWTAV
jgi:hypothetical protein